MVDFQLVNIPRGPGSKVIVLDRVGPLGQEPEGYCVHGKTKCIGCNHWVWLGDQTYELVVSAQASPLCQECGAKMLTPEMRVGHVDDSFGH